MSLETITAATALPIDASYRVSSDALRSVIGNCLALDEAAARALNAQNDEIYGYAYQERYAPNLPRLKAIDAHEDYIQTFLTRRRQDPQPVDYYRGRFVVSLVLSDVFRDSAADPYYGIGLWVRPLTGSPIVAS